MDDAYEVVVAAAAAREVGRLPAAVRRPILAALTALAFEPRAGKPLTGALRGLWSLRRGNYRILYRIDDPARKVEVARVGHRRDVYR
jgi:mRNA-degrading endonuclease RelE of RelBE toxin-antitoxin system